MSNVDLGGESLHVLDLVDRLTAGGVVLSTDAAYAIARVDLVTVGAKLLLSSVDELTASMREERS